MYKSAKLFVPRIPLHSVNMSEYTGMRGAGSNARRKIDIPAAPPSAGLRRTSHARTRSGSHVATRPPSCFKTRKRARPASRLGPARPTRRLLRTAGGDGVGAARLCCLPSCPRCPSTIEAVPACGRSWVRGGWWAAEARRAQLGVACLCCVIPCCAAAAALPPATSASRVSTCMGTTGRCSMRALARVGQRLTCARRGCGRRC